MVQNLLDTARTKYQNAETVREYYRNQIADIDSQLNNLDTMLNGCDDCIESIASGQRAVNNSSTNIIAISSSSVTANNTWINKVINGTATIAQNYDTIASTGTDKLLEGVKYVKVGSNIKFYNPVGEVISPTSATTAQQRNGTFRVEINNNKYEIPIKGLEHSSTFNLWLTNGINFIPESTTGGQDLGSSTHYWDDGYIQNLIPNTTSASTSGSTIGTSSNPYVTGYFNKITVGGIVIGGSGGTGNTDKFLRGDGSWSNELTGSLIVTGTNDGTTGSYAGNATTGNTAASIRTAGGIYAAKNIWAAKVFNAVFNDYAECRKSTIVGAGYVVIDQDDGTMIPSNERLQPGAQIVSDTYGHLMGMTEEAKTPIAVAGRVLAYTYRPREDYHAGMAVCSAPGGTIDIMTREEIRDYPDCIVGIVSEIPNYDTWGTDNIKVNGRIWIKVR